MELSSALSIAFFLLLCHFLLWWNYSRPKIRAHKLPPEAGGAKPFTGHLHVMSVDDGKLPHIQLSALADSHGPLFTIRLGVRRVVVVSSYKLVKELFTTHDAKISSRPNTRASKHLSYDYAMFGYSPYGPYWRQMRKLASSELLSARKVELLSDVCASETASFTRGLYEHWREKKNGLSGRVLVDMKQWLGDLDFNIILRIVAGKRFSGGDAEETKRLREVFRDFFKLAGMFVVGDAMPYLGWLDLGGHEKRMKKTAIEIDRMVGKWLEEHRRKKFSGEDEPQDFVDVMVKVMEGANFKGRYDADAIIKSTCLAIILAAADTTTVMSIWTVALLLNNRHALNKALEELDKHVGRERRVNFSDINNLQYLQAIVKETLRLYPAAPLGAIREITQDCSIAGFHISKGTWLMINIWKLHHDPEVWLDDPLEFKPERFLTTHKNIDVKGNDFELIPFGAGRRICPGANLGLRMLHLVLASLLQGFDISTIGDEKVDMTETAGLTHFKASPLDILVAPRLSPSLYY